MFDKIFRNYIIDQITLQDWKHPSYIWSCQHSTNIYACSRNSVIDWKTVSSEIYLNKRISWNFLLNKTYNISLKLLLFSVKEHVCLEFTVKNSSTDAKISNVANNNNILLHRTNPETTNSIGRVCWNLSRNKQQLPHSRCSRSWTSKTETWPCIHTYRWEHQACKVLASWTESSCLVDYLRRPAPVQYYQQ